MAQLFPDRAARKGNETLVGSPRCRVLTSAGSCCPGREGTSGRSPLHARNILTNNTPTKRTAAPGPSPVTGDLSRDPTGCHPEEALPGKLHPDCDVIPYMAGDLDHPSPGTVARNWLSPSVCIRSRYEISGPIDGSGGRIRYKTSS